MPLVAADDEHRRSRHRGQRPKKLPAKLLPPDDFAIDAFDRTLDQFFRSFHSGYRLQHVKPCFRSRQRGGAVYAGFAMRFDTPGFRRFEQAVEEELGAEITQSIS